MEYEYDSWNRRERVTYPDGEAAGRGYTKHYYAESERITSQIGRGNFSTLATPVTDTATANRKVRRADSLVLELNPNIIDIASQLTYLTSLTNRQNDTCEAYWYHPDHLGSSSWITYADGSAEITKGIQSKFSKILSTYICRTPSCLSFYRWKWICFL